MMKSTAAVVLFTILSGASGFSPVINQKAVAFSTASRLRPIHMFSAGDDKPTEPAGAKPLETVELSEEVDVAESEVSVTKTFKNLSTGEISEMKVDVRSDPTVSPWTMDWWAYILVSYPFILLADDFFHFLPEGGIWNAIRLKM